MRRIFVAGLMSVVFLGGCDSPVVEEKVHTVSEFKADEVLLKSYLSQCNENPGELAGKPNCINVTRAAQEMILEHREKQRKMGLK